MPTDPTEDDEPSDAESEVAKLRIYEVLREMAERLPKAIREDAIQEAALRLFSGSRDSSEMKEGYLWSSLRSARLGSVEALEVLSLDPDDAPVSAKNQDDDLDVRAMLRFLHPKDAEVIVLFHFEGLGAREIAERLGQSGRPVSPAAVDSRLRRARERFAKLLISFGFGVALIAALLPFVRA